MSIVWNYSYMLLPVKEDNSTQELLVYADLFTIERRDSSSRTYNKTTVFNQGI